jgi:hypothetical protein
MSDRRAVWVDHPPTVLERLLAVAVLAMLLLATANQFYFGIGLLGLTPKQLGGVGLLLALPFTVYWSGRVERR